MDIIEWVNCPFILLPPGETPPPNVPVLSEDDFEALRATGNLEWIPVTVPTRRPLVVEEQITDHIIRFRTRAVGAPHIIKMSYFPNWKVRGADTVYMVTPGFMLVYPRQAEVELYYGSTVSDNVGHALTMLGLACTLLAVVRTVRQRLVRAEK
jgi:hypothetical protein